MSDADGPTTSSALFGTDQTRIDTPTTHFQEDANGVKIETRADQAMRDTTIIEDVISPWGPEQVPDTTPKE